MLRFFLGNLADYYTDFIKNKQWHGKEEADLLHRDSELIMPQLKVSG